MSYEELFRLIDIDQNGELSLAEFTAFCETLPNAPPSNVVARLFSKADVDQSGFIDITEFGALCEGVKMLVKLGERELCDAYSTSELQRLFKYLATNGSSLRKDEVRKAADVVNESLGLKLSNDALALAIRDSGDHEWDFSAFRNLLRRVAPNHPLEQIVRAFKEEEIRRKERLTKVKSVFEQRKHQPDRSALESGPCVRCRQLQSELDEMATRSGEQADIIHKLEMNLADREEQDARLEVSRQLRTRELEAELDSKINDLDDMARMVSTLKAEKSLLEAKVVDLQRECADMNATRAELEQTKGTSDALRDEVTLLKSELDLARSSTERQESEMVQLTLDLSTSRRRCADLEEEIKRSSGVVEQLAASKESDSQKALSAFEELKRRCQEREDVATAAIGHSEAMKLRVQALEKDISSREVALSKKERELRDERLQLKKKYEDLFAKTQAQLDQQETVLNRRETDIATLEAEIHVRQQLLEHNVRRAEAVALPERERRMRLLQGIEAELCLRERNLRVAESQYINQLVEPEIARLRNENQRLREVVDEMRSARDAASTFMTTKVSGPAERSLERGILSPSFKLL